MLVGRGGLNSMTHWALEGQPCNGPDLGPIACSQFLGCPWSRILPYTELGAPPGWLMEFHLFLDALINNHWRLRSLISLTLLGRKLCHVPRTNYGRTKRWGCLVDGFSWFRGEVSNWEGHVPCRYITFKLNSLIPHGW